jgi:hypothetical protein
MHHRGFPESGTQQQLELGGRFSRARRPVCFQPKSTVRVVVGAHKVVAQLHAPLRHGPSAADV